MISFCCINIINIINFMVIYSYKPALLVVKNIFIRTVTGLINLINTVIACRKKITKSIYRILNLGRLIREKFSRICN